MTEQYMSDNADELIAKIEKREARVGVIGLGYVGLPLAIHLARQNFRVLGFDVDRTKVDALGEGKSYIRHIPSEPIRELSEKGFLQATDDFSRLAEVDCILICVPTPLTEHLEPDLSYLLKTTDDVAASLRKGQLIVLQSTTFPGTTEEMMLPRLSEKGREVGRDFFLAFSPEREDPGNKDFNASNTPKIVGGVTPGCLRAAMALYGTITKTVSVSSTKAAELTKLLENTYRAVNIALVNEMKILAHRMGIDLFEVINAAATKPFGFQPFYPGPGLGGHCIPIDPFYLSWKAREYGFDTRFIHLAGEVNVSMPKYVIDRTAEGLSAQGKELQGSRILILGVAYKKDIDDDRESPGYAIMDMLMDKGALVTYNDPWIPKLRPTRKYDFQLESVQLSPEVLMANDAVIIVTDHSAYDYVEIVQHARVIVDTRNTTVTAGVRSDKVILA